MSETRVVKLNSTLYHVEVKTTIDMISSEPHRVPYTVPSFFEAKTQTSQKTAACLVSTRSSAFVIVSVFPEKGLKSVVFCLPGKLPSMDFDLGKNGLKSFLSSAVCGINECGLFITTEQKYSILGLKNSGSPVTSVLTYCKTKDDVKELLEADNEISKSLRKCCIRVSDQDGNGFHSPYDSSEINSIYSSGTKSETFSMDVLKQQIKKNAKASFAALVAELYSRKITVYSEKKTYEFVPGSHTVKEISQSVFRPAARATSGESDIFVNAYESKAKKNN